METYPLNAPLYVSTPCAIWCAKIPASSSSLSMYGRIHGFNQTVLLIELTSAQISREYVLFVTLNIKRCSILFEFKMLNPTEFILSCSCASLVTSHENAGIPSITAKISKNINRFMIKLLCLKKLYNKMSFCTILLIY